MHPVLARFLSLDLAADTLYRAEQGQALKADERLYASIARGFPDESKRVLEARGKAHPSEEVQKAVVLLAAHAATGALREDPKWEQCFVTAQKELASQGATDSQVDHLLAALLLEEAFGDDASVDQFDAPFFEETLFGIAALTALTQPRVAALEEAFVRTAAPDWRNAHQSISHALLTLAWNEGPEPINADHVRRTVEVAREMGPSEDARALEALRRFLAFLHRSNLVGPLRLRRLEKVVDVALMELGMQRGPPS